MGLLVRTAVVVGVIYALSPLRNDALPSRTLSETGKSYLADPAQRAAEAAAALCRRDRQGCLAFGLQALGKAPTLADDEHPAASATASTRPAPAPLPRVAANGRIPRP